ncbi:uncharacterized protein N7484_008612 [Penicillium longicatenatum]|uniref:uncharacterized protein n=1 Tax=Penicillium longicatenatum TaxID=1561947 RepID=UPI0025487457|nr:uncharacterized protein N7484_008612 [Penicillium longicatenatum]KAJ5635299.1 hypothetical protein N7484_008612 [Penicillium longicatenatum]
MFFKCRRSAEVPHGEKYGYRERKPDLNEVNTTEDCQCGVVWLVLVINRLLELKRWVPVMNSERHHQGVDAIEDA